MTSFSWPSRCTVAPVVVGAVAAVVVAVGVAAVGGNEVIKVNALSRRLPEILVAVVFRGLCFTGSGG